MTVKGTGSDTLWRRITMCLTGIERDSYTGSRRSPSRGEKNVTTLLLIWISPMIILNKKWSCSVVSDSLRPHGLWPTRLLCPWDFQGKNTGVGCHFLLQGSSGPRDRTLVFRIVGRLFNIWATREESNNNGNPNWPHRVRHSPDWCKGGASDVSLTSSWIRWSFPLPHFPLIIKS